MPPVKRKRKMHMQRVYEFDAEHRIDWLSQILAPCALIIVSMVVV
jgi:hypothetical protein